jgi:hypothetical protein
LWFRFNLKRSSINHTLASACDKAEHKNLIVCSRRVAAMNREPGRPMAGREEIKRAALELMLPLREETAQQRRDQIRLVTGAEEATE